MWISYEVFAHLLEVGPVGFCFFLLDTWNIHGELGFVQRGTNCTVLDQHEISKIYKTDHLTLILAGGFNPYEKYESQLG